MIMRLIGKLLAVKPMKIISPLIKMLLCFLPQNIVLRKLPLVQNLGILLYHLTIHLPVLKVLLEMLLLVKLMLLNLLKMNPVTVKVLIVYFRILQLNREIKCNQDSPASVSTSTELQKDSSPQSEARTGQETAHLGSQIQAVKAQDDEKSHRKPHSNMVHDTQMQTSQTQGDHQVSTQGSHHGNHETSGGKHYLKDKYSQLTIYSKLY
ncbi:CYIR protein [Plasmodium cynomolgi strain B]|uniref:CYIR protein n=1 Tax=Plasmodium cynomolgi (strain B) TaxID=1120755 RepID=K6UNP4_PLACD|nr:CYIR protein [Plasmodium cynomolgi strain B]GAB69678.1 CYIR protein [Plasmodium cynomolgi strain B]